ncbi:MAG: 2-hydroxyacid dehydrogenase [Candidatus Saccharibacteria bacterium]|nr:2-hydroxyacid dehydrogenase [Pseudorhodobacter sp.]
MTKPHVLQMGLYPEWDIPPLEAQFVLHRLYEATDKAAFLAEIGPQIRAIATRGDVGASADVIAACPNLEIIAINGVGYDAIDFPSVRARGITVTNTPGVLDGECADIAVGMMLALARGMIGGDAWARSGDWAAKGTFPLQRRVWGQRAGILGLGRIGMELARRLQGFGMKISYLARSPKPVPDDWQFIADPADLAAASDFLFVTALADASTRHIVDARVLQALGPRGMLFNISRAQNIDELALLDALEAGSIGGASLDVFEGEPALNPRFTKLNNVVLQPHVGSATFETRMEMGKLVLDNLVAHFDGKPVLTEVK